MLIYLIIEIREFRSERLSTLQKGFLASEYNILERGDDNIEF